MRRTDRPDNEACVPSEVTAELLYIVLYIVVYSARI